MAGHGWVIPNDNGMLARCGGPRICPKCALELAREFPLRGRCPVCDTPKPARLTEREGLAGYVQLIRHKHATRRDMCIGGNSIVKAIENPG